MVQVNVRQKNIIDIVCSQALLMQRINQQRYAVIRSGINERRAPGLNDQVTRVLLWTRKLRIDGSNAIVKRDRLGAVAGQTLL